MRSIRRNDRGRARYTPGRAHRRGRSQWKRFYQRRAIGSENRQPTGEDHSSTFDSGSLDLTRGAEQLTAAIWLAPGLVGVEDGNATVVLARRFCECLVLPSDILTISNSGLQAKYADCHRWVQPKKTVTPRV